MTIRKSYKETCTYYDYARLETLKEAHKELPEMLVSKISKSILTKKHIQLSPLDFNTLNKLKDWEHSGKRVAQWDWEAVRKKYRTHPKRFEIAIWYKDNFLSGASIGRPTRNGNRLRLDFIEANPTHSPLSGLITDIVITAASVYAEFIGATQLRIMQPVNERVKNHYLSKPGFSFDQKGNFCVKEI